MKVFKMFTYLALMPESKFTEVRSHMTNAILEVPRAGNAEISKIIHVVFKLSQIEYHLETIHPFQGPLT